MVPAHADDAAEEPRVTADDVAAWLRAAGIAGGDLLGRAVGEIGLALGLAIWAHRLLDAYARDP